MVGLFAIFAAIVYVIATFAIIFLLPLCIGYFIAAFQVKNDVR